MTGSILSNPDSTEAELVLREAQTHARPRRTLPSRTILFDCTGDTPHRCTNPLGARNLDEHPRLERSISEAPATCTGSAQIQRLVVAFPARSVRWSKRAIFFAFRHHCSDRGPDSFWQKTNPTGRLAARCRQPAKKQRLEPITQDHQVVRQPQGVLRTARTARVNNFKTRTEPHHCLDSSTVLPRSVQPIRVRGPRGFAEELQDVTGKLWWHLFAVQCCGDLEHRRDSGNAFHGTELLPPLSRYGTIVRKIEMTFDSPVLADLVCGWS